MEIPSISTTQDRVSVETNNFDTEEEKNKILGLFEVLEHLSFPFLAALIVKSEDDKTICVEHENFSGSTVEQFIQKQIQSNEAIDEQKLLDFASQGALTLAFLHKHKLIHSQISSQNLSFAEDGTLRFGHVDFRVSVQFQDLNENNEQELKNLQSEDMHNFGKNIDQRPNAIQLLAQAEIQEITNIWKQQQPNSQSPTEIARSQFSNCRSYLAQLLIEIAGASIQDRLEIVKRGEFVELTNILKWARDQNKELS
ncbi:MAG: hypothetical protein EZS28_040194 [Streblomastix strix]|uniref:Protein kinase domain-containing protein n=1 Tax=Streblomastix strix TaxID=222440 RepID=A0A5J4U1V2_9EUKA|nr:MAG: hypothetical protein EZS28_040194 [Streblomastix strix]